MATYQIGQSRFQGKGCVTDMTAQSSIDYVSVVTGGDDSSSTLFQDVAITPLEPFSEDSDYYLFMKIPQDLNYDLTFNIKLLKKQNNTTEVYQFLKNITVSRGGTGSNVYTCVLYEKSTGEVDVVIPETYKSGAANTKDVLYWDKTNDKFYLGRGGTSYAQTDKYNKISVSASWKSGELGDRYGTFEVIFRPVEAFTQILVQMVRTEEDYNIRRTVTSADGGTTTEYGRKLDTSKVQYNLYKLTDQVKKILGSDNATAALSRIGVWSHPGLVMAVNGEEIRVGPSGFYELDTVPVETLGIVAPDGDYNNNWTVDYEYKQTEEEG